MANTVKTFLERKASGEKITMLTAYDYPTAKLISDAGVDSILVGDSVGTVMLGYDSTVPVTVDDMIHHGKAVVRGAGDAFVVVDMPFMSYQASVEDALRNAGRILKETGCGAVKLEGGEWLAPTIRALVQAGIPVNAHIGLTPQSVNVFGGNKVQGKDLKAARQFIADLKAVEDAGAFAITLECVPPTLATLATEITTTAATIGIGAGPNCDGQVLVWADMVGLLEGFKPKMVKRYALAHELLSSAFASYDAEVKSGDFPTEEYSYLPNEEVVAQLRDELGL